MNKKNYKLTRHCRLPSIRFFATGLMLQMFATSGFAAGEPSNLDEARKLLDAGRAEQSAALIEQDLLNFAGDADYDYLLGLALYQAGQVGQALFAFERVLMVDPGNVDARLKAAQISVERGNLAYASELLTPLSARRLSDKQQHQVSQIRLKITAAASAEPIAMHGYVLGGIGWDDNVTSGPNQTELIIPALNPFGPTTTALGNATRAHDLVGMLEAGLSARKVVNENTWLTGDGNIRQGISRSRGDVTESFANLNLGALKRNGREFFGATLLAQNYLVGAKTYRSALGGRLHWMHSFNDSSWLTSYFQQLTFDYPGNAIDNATHSIFGVTHEFTTANDTQVLQYGIYGGREIAEDKTKPHFSFHILGASLGGSMAIGADLSLYAGIAYESQRHDAVDALYLYTRNDSSRSVGITADYRLNDRWHMLPQFSRTHNASNTALYDYTRNAFMLQFRWEFDNAKN
ncbi:MAG: tetratricopeptide repeat protein [Gallionella sp.]